MFVLVLATAQVGFGSIPIAIRYYRGDRLILTPSTIQVEGLTQAKPVRFTADLRNDNAKPVRLLGSAVSCSCLAVKEMADSIPVNGRTELVFEVHALPGKPDVDQRVVFFTDDPRRPQLVVHVTAKVRE